MLIYAVCNHECFGNYPIIFAHLKVSRINRQKWMAIFNRAQMECREEIKDATGFLLDLVNNILDMNKLESGKIVLEHQLFDLLEVLDTEYPKHVQVVAPESEADFSGRKVLLVEDNALNQEIARFMLENAGMQVTTAGNGKEAIEIFQASNEYDFDLILMDVMMPVMDGLLTATRTIRALPRADAQTIPIFAITANAFTDDIEESHEIASWISTCQHFRKCV